MWQAPGRWGGEHNHVQNHETKYHIRFEITLGFKLHITKSQAELAATREHGPENLKFQSSPSLIPTSPNAGAAAPPGVNEWSVPAAHKSNWQSANGPFILLARIPSMVPALGEPAINMEKQTSLTTDFSRTGRLGSNPDGASEESSCRYIWLLPHWPSTCQQITGSPPQKRYLWRGHRTWHSFSA